MTEHTNFPYSPDSPGFASDPDSGGVPPKRPGFFARHKVATAVAGVVIVGAGIGAGIGASGDDGGQTDTAAAATSTTAPLHTGLQAPQPTRAPVSMDDVFIQVVDSEGIYYSSRSDLIRFAHTVCDAFAAGATFQQVGVTLLSADTPYSPGEIGSLMGASVGAYCPEYSDVADESEGVYGA